MMSVQEMLAYNIV